MYYVGVLRDDQRDCAAAMEGNFPVKWKWVSESTADFLAAVEPQPLWTGSLPVCLVEYHPGLSRRLRLVLTSQTHLTKGELSLLDEQHPVHGRIHNSGLLFGYAADRCTEPDWYVLPDGHQPNAWKLLHAARKRGDRFCVGSGPRYAPGQAGSPATEPSHRVDRVQGRGQEEDKTQPQSPATELTEFRGAAKRRTRGGQGPATEPSHRVFL